MFFASRCPGCGRTGPSPCASCVAGMEPSRPVPVPPSLDRCRALLNYDGAAREVVAQVKYRNARSPIAWLAVGVASLVLPGEVDLVTWAPTTASRRRRRGFDHAELLARRVARQLGVPCQVTLLRAPGLPQTGRLRHDRRHGPTFRPVCVLTGRRVALVDDVITTGATLEAAGRVLRLAGVHHLVGVAAAHPA